MGEHRWEGYRHPELFDLINDGPGPDGSLTSVRRWEELTRALGEIDSGLAGAVAAAAAGWRGAAADSAQEGLRPLGAWAEQARQAAADMRERAEQQAEFIGKARRDMPPPVPVTSEEPGAAMTLLTHLFGGQTDHEVQEAERDAAERRAFEVMRTYESATRTNTTSLASFVPPPQVVVDTPGSAGGGGVPGQQQPITMSWGGAAAAGGAAGGALAGGSAAAGAATGRSGSGRT
ncbi:PPE domain-containing protein, partial [Saccharopolyspora sp. HNM0983]